MAACTHKPYVQRGRGDPYPHIQVNTGQKFVMEWATGHGGPTYWVFLKEEDGPKLATIGRGHLYQYIKCAFRPPPPPAAPPPPHTHTLRPMPPRPSPYPHPPLPPGLAAKRHRAPSTTSTTSTT